MEKLYDEYTGYIEKLKTEWENSAVKAKEHGNTEDYVKGQIKIQVADALEQIFKAKYKSVKG